MTIMSKNEFDALARERKWTLLLKALPVAKGVMVSFPDADSIKCCQSVAYAGYGDLSRFRFGFTCDGIKMMC